MAKTLNTKIVLSDDFARAYERPLTSLGYHSLRGLAKPHELFAPAIATQPAQSLFISDRMLCAQPVDMAARERSAAALGPFCCRAALCLEAEAVGLV